MKLGKPMKVQYRIVGETNYTHKGRFSGEQTKIFDLVPGTDYEIVISIINSAGLEGPSSITKITTQEGGMDVNSARKLILFQTDQLSVEILQ